MKKFFMLLMIGCTMVLLALWPTNVEAASVKDIYYSVYDGEVIIYDSNASATGELDIPETIQGYPVTRIQFNAFYGCSGLTAVTIPNTVRVIEHCAFYNCSGLEYVSIPDSVTEIEYSAFEGCTKLKTVTIPGSITLLDDRLFFGCSSLESVIIGNGVTCIEASVFENCTQLTSVSIPNSVTELGRKVFMGCSSLQTVVIPNSVSKISNELFLGCSSLAAVTIPEGVTVIEYSAFENCVNLISVRIPGSVTIVGGDSFRNCGNLKSVYITDVAAWCNTEFLMNPFQYASELYVNDELVTDLVVPEGVTAISKNAFSYCDNLSSITLPESLKSIGEQSFYKCTGLTQIVIPEGVTTVERDAFSGCTNLTSVTVPETMKRMGNNAFYQCSGLEAVYISDLAAWCAIAFEDTTASNPLECGKNLYMNGQPVTALVIPEGVTGIGDRAFVGCSSITAVTIPDSVTTIGAYAFDECTNMTTVTIGSGVASVGLSAFHSCNKLKDVHIKDLEAWCNIDFAFYESTPFNKASNLYINGESVTELVIPDSVKAIKQYTFCGMKYVTSISLPESVTSIGSFAFCNCSNLKTLSVPENVTTIGDYAFDSCSQLEHIVIPDGVTRLGIAVFDTCSNLTTVTLGKGVREIDISAFYYCYKLTSINIPTNLTSVSGYAFYGCRSLNSVTYCGTEEQWNKIAIESNNEYLTSAPRTYHRWQAASCELGKSCVLCGVVDKLPHSFVNGVCTACSKAMSGYVRMDKHMELTRLQLTEDLYIDLNGYDLTGTIVTNGYRIYGMDSTTDGYSCTQIGYFNCVDEHGDVIVPQTHFKSDISGSIKRYVTVKTDNGYSFHRFYMAITHQTLRPESGGVGYKAVFYADEMVVSNMDSYGFTMQLDGYQPVCVKKNGDSFVSGKTISLCMRNFDVENHGETDLSAWVQLRLKDGTLIESTSYTMTFRSLIEQIDGLYPTLSTEKQKAVYQFVGAFNVLKQWNLPNLLENAYDEKYI